MWRGISAASRSARRTAPPTPLNRPREDVPRELCVAAFVCRDDALRTTRVRVVEPLGLPQRPLRRGAFSQAPVQPALDREADQEGIPSQLVAAG